MAIVGPEPEQVRAALEEILGWQGISRSPQLGDLLRYVVEKTLAGEQDSIKAYSIAVDVFGRPQSFDAQADPIVRVQARRLRTLLEQFYASGLSTSPIEIRLPLGRYVPDFVAVETVAPAASRRHRWRRFLMQAGLAFSFVIVGAAIAVGVLRLLPQQRSSPPSGSMPSPPRVTVGSFDNLTGDPLLDPEISRLRERLVTGLSRFEAISASQEQVAAADPLLSVSIQDSAGRFYIRATLTQDSTDARIWSTTESVDRGGGDNAALAAAVSELVTKLANARGPLHAPGRAWLAEQGGVPPSPTLYVCQLQYMVWRDTQRLNDAAEAIDCFGQIAVADAGDAIALAGRAGLSAWRAQFDAGPGDATTLFAGPVAAATKAVALRPDSSFVLEMQGLTYMCQGSFDTASSALSKAIQINPANMDARAAQGLTLWLRGDFRGGEAVAEAALGAVSLPPPFYYTVRALDALREKKYFDAVDAAQALIAGDSDLGPVLALASAPRVGRTDLVDRYRTMVLNNPRFQFAGIMSRLRNLVPQQVVLDRIREGLTLAGVPPVALDKPFNADGSVRR